MKCFIFVVAMAMSLSACDNTKMQLRAPVADEADATTATAKTEVVKKDTVKMDTSSVVVKH
jgi:hypothetical protein